ncbi:MAG: hypothetical protein R3300_21600 [Candidatus Promineifilaceae bacterium]|nr:hypothetical protein [Candidatus Promineifilaceae bacterium]
MADKESALQLIRSLDTAERLNGFANALSGWLMPADATTTVGSHKRQIRLTDNQARLLLHTAGRIGREAAALQQPFSSGARKRSTLYHLLQETDLAAEVEVQQLLANDARTPPAEVAWLALVVSAFGWRAGYDVSQLDPASPPVAHTPASQSLRRSLRFLHCEAERSAAEIERLHEMLTLPAAGFRGGAGEDAGGPVPPLPPHFRPPVPERYPEIARETIEVRSDDIAADAPPSRTEPLVISSEDLETQPAETTTLRIETEAADEAGQQPPSPLPRSGVIMPNSASHSRWSLSLALGQLFRQERLKSTRLVIMVKRYPSGPGLRGLQVRVSCKGIKNHLAGVTNAEGTFTCELPVREGSGLTYDVAVTWPRELGAAVEQKSITLNADRTRFELPFYYQLSAPEPE